MKIVGCDFHPSYQQIASFGYRDRGGGGEEADACQRGGGEVLPRARSAGADWHGSDGECPLV